MDNNLSFHIKVFNDRVRAMTQANSKNLVLNAEEARSLHAEIFDLLATIASLSKDRSDTATSISMDGGGFK